MKQAKMDGKDGKTEGLEAQTTCWAHLQMQQEPHYLTLCHCLTLVFNNVTVFRDQKSGKNLHRSLLIAKCKGVAGLWIKES